MAAESKAECAGAPGEIVVGIARCCVVVAISGFLLFRALPFRALPFRALPFQALRFRAFVAHFASETSTRRFSARPFGVALSATGRVAPNPSGSSRSDAMP